MDMHVLNLTKMIKVDLPDTAAVHLTYLQNVFRVLVVALVEGVYCTCVPHHWVGSVAQRLGLSRH